MFFTKQINIKKASGFFAGLFLALIHNPFLAQTGKSNFCDAIKMDLNKQLPPGWVLEGSDPAKIVVSIPDSVLYFWPANDINPSYVDYLEPPKIEGKIKYTFSIYFKTGQDHWTDSLLKRSLAHNDSIKDKISEANKTRRNSFQSYLEWKSKIYGLNSRLMKLPVAKNNTVTVFTADNLIEGFFYFLASDVDKNNLIAGENKFYKDRKAIKEICLKAIIKSFGSK